MNWKMLRSILSLKPLSLLALLTVFNVGALADCNWSILWYDEFEGPAGQLPDPIRWDFDIGTGWGNNQLEYDTDRPENASLDGEGHLLITAREEQYEGCDYTSARIVTRDLFEPVYGRFEARMRLPVGQGFWPAFWLLGADVYDIGWPLCGEIDIMENLGHQPDILYTTLHGPGYSGGGGIGQSYNLPAGGLASEFHIYAVEWGSDTLHWFIDGIPVLTLSDTDLPGDWVFDHPFYIIINLAVGGSWPGPPDQDTVFPQSVVVDWVRVYEAIP